MQSELVVLPLRLTLKCFWRFGASFRSRGQALRSEPEIRPISVTQWALTLQQETSQSLLAIPTTTSPENLEFRAASVGAESSIVQLQTCSSPIHYVYLRYL